MTPAQEKNREKAHRFGGDWTIAKLNVVAKYLTAYATALHDKPSPQQPFQKAYIDAFAGTGYREPRHERAGDSKALLFPDLADQESQDLLEGSAIRALRIQPPFDKYIFIENNPKRCKQLENLKSQFPELASQIDIRMEDANTEIQRICSANWSSHRAVLFLDPYGMQVEWKTIEAVAATHAIDLWLLFPLGMGVNRLLKRSGDIPINWRQRLNVLLGTEEWYDEFYKIESITNLFEQDNERVIKASIDVIGRYFNDRLKQIFAGVADRPGVLRNSHNNPLYLLCFAMGNKRGAPIALRIAKHLLQELH